MAARFTSHEGARQIYDMTIDLVQTSCGYAVPLGDTFTERDTLHHWTKDRGPDSLQTYWSDRNSRSIDGYPTYIESKPHDS